MKTVLENKNNIKFIGRTSYNKNGAFVYYSAAGIEFNAKINGCLKVTMQASRIDHSKSGGIYFKVFLFGFRWRRRSIFKLRRGS